MRCLKLDSEAHLFFGEKSTRTLKILGSARRPNAACEIFAVLNRRGFTIRELNFAADQITVQLSRVALIDRPATRILRPVSSVPRPLDQ